ncbi:MAG: hypothetical protein ACOCQQ_02240 [Candidatus Nanoarchaeia archaeon]
MTIKKSFSELVSDVENSKAFKNVEDEKNYYLAHIFFQLNNAFELAKPIQLGWYCKEQDHLSMFEITSETIKHNGFEEAFKDGGIIEELQLTTSSCTLDEAKKIIDEILKKDFPEEHPNSYLCIAQNVKGKNILNCTVICISFAMISIHIDLETKEVIHKQKNSILDLKKETIKGEK